MRGICEAVQERNRHRLELLAADLLGHGIELSLSQRHRNGAVHDGALGHLVDEPRRHWPLRLHPAIKVGSAWNIGATYLEHMPKATRRDEPCPRASALENGIGGEG